MPNSIKYTTSTETKALRKGNFYIAVGDDPKAPTSQNGYWVGYDVPPGGYVTYINKESGGPSIYTSANDSDLISITNIIDSPSINFITNNPTPTTNTSGYSVVGGVGSLSLDESEMAIRWTRTSYETWGAYVLNNSLSNYQFDTFSSYTSTFEWKLGPLHTADTTYDFQIINGPSTYIILSVSLLSNSTLQENGWYRFTRNQIPPLDGSGETVQYRIITGSKGLLVTDIYWRGLEYRKTIKTNKEQCFNYFAGQSDKMVVNKQYPTIVTDGLVLNLDAGYLPSYPGTSSTWYDLGTYSNNGALTNGPTFNSNGLFDFDGVNDFISIGNVIDFTVGSYTISFLIKIDSSSTSFQTIIAKKGVAAANAGYAIYYNGNTKKLMWSNGNGSVSQEYYTINEIPTDKWIHITKIRDVDGATKGYFYINGNIFNITSNPTGLNVSNSFDLTINRSSNSSTYFFKGKTNNTNIYSKALSTNEILQNYYQAPIVTDGLEFAIDAGNLVSYEGGATTSYTLNSGIAGLLLNGIGYTQSFGGAWTFDGSDDVINFGNILNYTNTTSFSTEVWFNWDGSALPSNLGHLIGKTFASYRTFIVSGAGSAAISFRLDSNFQMLTTGYVILPNKWYQVVSTWESSNSTAKIFINGVERASVTNTGIDWTFSGSNFQMGTSPGENYWFKGLISIGRTYNKSLTIDEIIQNFRAQKSRFGI
jgi:hypothetical protein